MNLILIFSIISFFIQNFLSFIKFKNLINPISLFTIIHFFHNWSFSLSKYFNDYIFWRADPSVSYSTIYDVLYINLIGSWVFFTVIILFSKTLRFKNYYQIIKVDKLVYIYYFLSVIFFIRFLLSFYAGNIYGSNQAIDSISAFDPVARILFFRVVACCIYLVLHKPNRKILILIFLIELLLSLLTTERKELSLIIVTYFIANNLYIKFNIIKIFRYLSLIVSSFYFLLFIPIYRSINYIDSFISRSYETFIVINQYGYSIIFQVLNLSNSEGVQNWTYQLIEDGKMSILYGKSYLQALINLVILRPFQGETISSWQGAYHFKSVAYPYTTNHGWDFTFTAEAIQNFGLNYSFISFFLLGLLIVYLYNNRNRSDFYKVLYYFTWPMLVISFRTDMTSMLRIYSYVFFIFIILLLSNRIKLKSKDIN